MAEENGSEEETQEHQGQNQGGKVKDTWRGKFNERFLMSGCVEVSNVRKPEDEEEAEGNQHVQVCLVLNGKSLY